MQIYENFNPLINLLPLIVDTLLVDPRDYRPKADKTSNSGSDAIRGEKQRSGVNAPAPNQPSGPGGNSFITKLSPQNERTVKQLLGELYVDKEFLENMYHDRDFVTNPNEAVRQLVFEGLKFLEARTEFWRQQKPLYARKKEAVRPKTQQANQNGNKKSSSDEEAEKNAQATDAASLRKRYPFDTEEAAQQWIDERWSQIHRALENENHDKALRLTNKFLADVSGKDLKKVEALQLIPNKVMRCL